MSANDFVVVAKLHSMLKRSTIKRRVIFAIEVRSVVWWGLLLSGRYNMGSRDAPCTLGANFRRWTYWKKNPIWWGRGNGRARGQD